ncbi:MAG: hypothetical protein JSS99_08615 [Actinobacteria bacterium]|nr:hypothetical protein [Actinomycetota bacterium]
MWWPPRLGEPLPRGAEAVGIRRKLSTYSLVLEHTDGGPKAYLFKTLLGITLAEIEHLAAEIQRGLPRRPVVRVTEKPNATVTCGVLIPVRGVGVHEGRVLPVTTGWELRYVGDRPRMVTAYIKGR